MMTASSIVACYWTNCSQNGKFRIQSNGIGLKLLPRQVNLFGLWSLNIGDAMRVSLLFLVLVESETHWRGRFEIGLVLGYYNPTQASLPPLPDQKVFLSTPIGHSRKPVLLGTSPSLLLQTSF